jgi:hypothetical protein
MTARGGPRTPDGVQRPASLPFAQGPNRSDMSALPGTPGTPLPPSPAEPMLEHGQAGSLRQTLMGIPGQAQNFGTVPLDAPSKRPGEPITTGIPMGQGAGPEGLLPSPVDPNNKAAVAESLYFYPVLMRLAQLPGASTQTKIFAQRVRSMLPTAPERMPRLPGE